MKFRKLLLTVALGLFGMVGSAQATHLFSQAGEPDITLLPGQQVTIILNGTTIDTRSSRFWFFESGLDQGTDVVLLTLDGSSTLLDDASDWNNSLGFGPAATPAPNGPPAVGSEITIALLSGDGFTLLGYDWIDSGIGGYAVHGPTGTVTYIERFDKEITNGPDVDVNGEIDLVVEVGQTATTAYDFSINYINGDFPEVLIEDTVPAEWQVTLDSDDNGFASIRQANKKDNDKSATKIDWWPMAGSTGVIDIAATTRGHKRNGKFKPTSCGTLSLNNGAAAYELDPLTGEPVLDPLTGERAAPLQESNALCLAAVSDENGDGMIARDGTGDEDGDGLSDYGEACGEVRTDPCNEDTDGDGVNDGVDLCPLEAAVVDADGDGCEDPPLTTFSGVATDMPASDLVGWETCYSDTYGNNNLSLAADIQASCTKANVMLACSAVGSGVLKVAAHAPRADVFFVNAAFGAITPHTANGVDWYFSSSYSMGFLHQGDDIFLSQADTATGAFPEEKISWHTLDGFGGGWRCGTARNLNGSNDWERIVYHAD